MRVSPSATQNTKDQLRPHGLAAVIGRLRGRRLSRFAATSVVVLALALTACTAATSDASASGATTSAAAITEIPRATDCPAATVTVGSTPQLQSALSAARPGTVIKLLAGSYLGQFKLNASGTTSAPIWVCGPRTAILTTGSFETGNALILNSVSNVVVAGFTVRDAFKGVTVINGSRVALTDLAVSNIGYEAIHLRNQTIDTAVNYNEISHTGLVVTKYGEGIYIGTSGANWCSVNACEPDRTDRVIIRGNRISDTGAQPIEAKEGTTGGIIEDNVLTGSSRIEPNSKSLILIKGNGYTVDNNVVNAPRMYGIQTLASDGGWGRNNSFAANQINGAPDMGIWIHQPTYKVDGALGNVVYCSNTSPGVALTNVRCTP